MFLSLFDESVNFLLGKSSLLVGDGDVRGLSSSLVLSSDSKDAVGIQIERDLNLGNSSGGRGNSIKVEFAQKMVISSHGPLSFEDLDLDSGLVISIGSEHLSLLNRDSGVPLNKFGHNSSSSLDSKRKRGDVQQKELVKILSLILVENSGLNGGAVGDGLIWVDGLI